MNIKELLGDAYRDDMTIAEIEDVLKDKEMPVDKSAEVEERYKKLISKANSEAAEYKKQLQAHKTEEERRADEAAELAKRKDEELETLRKQVSVANYTSQFMSIGFEQKLAEEAADSLYSGDYSKVFDSYKKHLSDYEAKIKANLLDSSPKPTGGMSTAPAITKDQFDKMSYKDRVKLHETQPEVYEQLIKK